MTLMSELLQQPCNATTEQQALTLGYLCVEISRLCFGHETMSRKSRDNFSTFPIWISEIYDVFCRLFLFQLRVYFVVCI